jgi:phage terminase large subunit
MFIYTTAIKKLRKLTKRKKIIQGGTSAGKTFGIIPILINQAIKTPNLEISVVSESIPHLRRGAIRDFIKIMKWTNRWITDHWNKTLLTYSFSNGSHIEFFSVDQDDKLRGARRHVLYINEANNVSHNAYNELSIRTSKDIWMDFNPTAQFWAHTDVAEDKDSELIILTYLDNEGLPQTIVDDIESKKAKAKTSEYWANWWEVYGLGNIGSLEGVVFNNWKTIDTIPKEARLLGYGMDFGYTNDPSTLIAAYKYNDQLIWDEIIHQKGLLNSDLVRLMKSNEVNNIVYADSAEPKSIAEIKARGITIKATDKGKDSIVFGIDIMQGLDMLVTSRSTNTIKELRAYTWDKDKTGSSLNKPIDAFNHSIDAMRYFCMMHYGKPNSGVYHVY